MANFENPIIIGAVGLTYLFFDLSLKLEKEHFLLKIFYFLTATWLVVLDVGLIQNVAYYASAAGPIYDLLTTFYLIVLWMAIGTTLYFIVYLLFKHMWNVKEIIRKVGEGKNPFKKEV